MSHKLIIYTFFLFLIFSCKNKEMNTTTTTNTDNPLMVEFDTPYGVPPFHLIKNEHYKPAFEAAMAKNKEEIDGIANATETPDFENTIVALDKTGSMLNRISSIFFNMTGAHTNDTLEQISQEMAPVLAKHSDYTSLNKKLFDRVKAVWDNRTSAKLNEEQNQLLEKTYKSFIRNGALLNDKEKETITKINEELSLLAVKFGQNNLAEVNDFKLVVDKKEDLKFVISDLSGKITQQHSFKANEGSNLVMFDTHTLSAGMYFLTIGNASSSKTMQFVVK
jgi:peptidyl-dipeptidase Dcp